MISVDEAEQILFEYSSSHKKTATELCGVDGSAGHEYLGRILAEDIHSPIDLPDFDNSAMDGYALNISDIEKLGDIPILPIKGESAAGSDILTLEQGTCMRIFTGAPIPDGADAVVPQENCEYIEDTCSIRIMQLPQRHHHIRPSKENFAVGDIVFKKGDVVSMELLTVLASLGLTELKLYKKLNVGICVTGSELQKPGTPLKKGEIYESNGVFLEHILRFMHCNVIKKVHITDEREDTEKTLLDLCNACDIVICTGGVSVGKRDFIKDIIQEHGNTFIRKVKIKPGKPFTFSEIQGTPVFGLPGNPLSTYITFLWLVLPFIRVLQCSNDQAKKRTFPVKSPLDFPPYARTQFVFANLDIDTMSVHALENQGSSSIKNIIFSNTALIVPQDTAIKAGDTLQCWIFDHRINL